MKPAITSRMNDRNGVLSMNLVMMEKGFSDRCTDMSLVGPGRVGNVTQAGLYHEPIGKYLKILNHQNS